MSVEKDISWYRDRIVALTQEVDDLLASDPPPVRGDPAILDRLAELGMCKRAVAGLEAKTHRE